MSDKDTKGFVFKNVVDSKIEQNDSRGHDVGFEVIDAKGIEFIGNTASVETRRAIDEFTFLREKLASIELDFAEKEDLKEIIDETISQLNQPEQKKSILKMFVSRLDTILVGVATQLAIDGHADFMEIASNALDALKDLI